MTLIGPGLQVSPSAVRALSFNTVEATAKSQLLAIGDDEGVLRVAEVPSTLRRPMQGEHRRMSRFLEAQTHKVADTESRQVWEQRPRPGCMGPAPPPARPTLR